jgi:propionyl-CoA synthetase
MEEVIAAHPDVAECAVVGMAVDFKGQLPLGFVVLKAGVERDPQELVAELVRMIREQIGAVASFKKALIVKRLPKTRSGKILRGTMRKVADGAPYTIPSTIDDPAILDEIADSLDSAGYGKTSVAG